ncbi:MAG: DNA replication and repair protein RecF [Prevotella sp.]|nr:DNA replication and repair protein RecF [Prevotella sp.]MCM1074986.1 DNA replication and repair protein RecF [Ruminococcus sp.]
MWLKNISILNFKNIREAEVEFCAGVNCLVGANGMGKSNLLEAVYYLSMTRSFLRLPDAEVLRRGAEAMSVRGEYAMDADRNESVSIGYVPPRRKTLRRSGKEERRMSAHIGLFPIVLVSPQDHYVVTGGPDERRRLTDMVISQADGFYLEALIRYGKALTARNSMLKQGVTDALLMEGIEQQLVREAQTIYERRSLWADSMREPFCHYYRGIAGVDEAPSLEYESIMGSKSLMQALDEARARDGILGYTSVGIHRDDLSMKLGGRELRHFGSQGQIKTFTIALRLAVYECLNKRRGVKPLLLLDDIFDKLDASRVANIMQVVGDSEVFGQIFITDTGRENMDAVLSSFTGEKRLFEVADGEYKPISGS